MNEETFAIRLPDGIQHTWTIRQIMAYHEDGWQVVLAEGEVFCQTCGAATPDLCVCDKGQDVEE